MHANVASILAEESRKRMGGMKHSVGRWRQGDGAHIIDVPRTCFTLRGVAFALSAQLVFLGVAGGVAHAEDRPIQVFSACHVAPRDALGTFPKIESKEARTERALAFGLG